MKEKQEFIDSANKCVLSTKNAGIMGRAYGAEIILRAKIRGEKNTEAVCRMLSHGEFLVQKIVGGKRVVEDYKL